ncbi:hypothetical protein KC19_3G149000 [Ceratodon purpureus]|uniref:Uncharacterized protein n=1 Tax=Ceratodon purpureus TaxID=3225 RepID=A0A8T0IK08_CERPU|nr:hypothetical protein KC19_3G149000 [Ceratodon purpureus]
MSKCVACRGIQACYSALRPRFENTYVEFCALNPQHFTNCLSESIQNQALRAQAAVNCLQFTLYYRSTRPAIAETRPCQITVIGLDSA